MSYLNNIKKSALILSICFANNLFTIQAQSVGNVNLSQIVYGDNETKTSYFHNPNDQYCSGFFNQNTGTNMPYETWWHMIINRHVNTNNNYQFQIAADFWGESAFFRKIADGTPKAWRRIMNDGQDPYAATLNQSLKTSDNVTFGGATLFGDLKLGVNAGFSTISGPTNSGAIQIKSNSSVGGSTNRYLRLGWNDNNAVFTPVLSINDDQNVGIGTTTPTSGVKLDVNGIINTNADIQLGSAQGNSYLKLNTNSRSWWAGVGVTSDDDRFVIFDQTTYTHALTIGTDGNVGIGIGTAQAICKLEVNGTVHAKEVKVDLGAPLADYVFDDNYKLMPLHQVEQFVKANNHLPEIPSAAEVSKNGLSIGEMQNKLLQKVEELTLYVIEQQKKINQQNARIEELEKHK